MPRDIICFLRIFVDSLPKFIRNSKSLFKITKFIFNIPEELYNFREKYKKGFIKDLSIFYDYSSEVSIKRISNNTDINSFHLSIIEKFFLDSKHLNILDVGCGTGFLTDLLNKKITSSKIIGIDFNAPSNKSIKTSANKNNIQFISCNINSKISEFKDKQFDVVLCTHVLEHLNNPQELLSQMRRIVKKSLIIICPLEKEHKWGMNFHVNFFPSNRDFIKFLLFNQKSRPKWKTIQRLGDSMYIESY